MPPPRARDRHRRPTGLDGFGSRTPRWRRLVAGAAFLILMLTGCVGSARTREDYRLKASSSAKSAGSAVATAALGARLVRSNHAFANYLAVLYDSADRDTSSVQSTFASIQPPDRASDRLRDRLGTLLNDVSDTVSTMRVAARRHAWHDLLDTARQLPRLQRRLQRYENLS